MKKDRDIEKRERERARARARAREIKRSRQIVGKMDKRQAGRQIDEKKKTRERHRDTETQRYRKRETQNLNHVSVSSISGFDLPSMHHNNTCSVGVPSFNLPPPPCAALLVIYEREREYHPMPPETEPIHSSVSGNCWTSWSNLAKRPDFGQFWMKVLDKGPANDGQVGSQLG